MMPVAAIVVLVLVTAALLVGVNVYLCQTYRGDSDGETYWKYPFRIF